MRTAVRVLAQIARHRTGGDRAMRHPVLLLRTELPDGSAADRLGRGFEQRVVSEPILASEAERDSTVEPARARHHEAASALAPAVRIGRIEIGENAHVVS